MGVGGGAILQGDFILNLRTSAKDNLLNPVAWRPYWYQLSQYGISSTEKEG